MFRKTFAGNGNKALAEEINISALSLPEKAAGREESKQVEQI